MDVLDRIGLAHPVVQAGMGGGIAGGELAGAVSAAGALGSVGILAPPAFRDELVAASERADGRPVAANLLVPFTRADHLRICIEQRVPVVVFHGGSPAPAWIADLQSSGSLVLPTVGNLEQAHTALAAGADGVVVQGVEAGGHLMGDEPLAALLPRVRELGSFPILAAGGVVDAADVRALLDAGADAAVAGTRFLMTDESRAHPAYKQRLREATTTLRTTLFGVGWLLEHRVIPNAATERWVGASGDVPWWIHRVEQLAAPLARRLPLRSSDVMASRQRAALPLFGPSPPLEGMPDSAVDRAALYAGETVRRIDDIVPAGEAVARLTGDG